MSTSGPATNDEIALDLASVVRQSADQIFVIDATSALFLFANDRALRATGYALEELRKMTQLDLQVGVTLAEMTVRVAPLRTGDQDVLTDPATYRRKDGSTYGVEHRVQLLDGQDPAVYVVQARELALPRAGDASNAASPDLYRRMVEDADEGIWVIDGDNKTTYANAAIAKLLGYAREEMLGMSVFSFMDEEGRTIAAANLKRRREGVHQQLEFKYVRRDGSELWTIIATHPMFDAAGAYSGAFAIVTDITDRKEQERRLLERLHLEEGEQDAGLANVDETAVATWMPNVSGLRSTLVAKRFALLAEPRRLELIELLASGEERSVTALAGVLRMSQSNVSKHLRVLWEAGLLARRARSPEMLYSLADPTVAILCRIVCQWLGKQAQAELRALAS